VHEAISGMIDGCCAGNFSKTVGPAVIKLGALGRIIQDRHVKTEHALLLSLSEIGEEIGLEPGSVPFA